MNPNIQKRNKAKNNTNSIRSKFTKLLSFTNMMYAHLPQTNHRDKEPAENKKKDTTTKNKTTTQQTNETTHKLRGTNPLNPTHH